MLKTQVPASLAIAVFIAACGDNIDGATDAHPGPDSSVVDSGSVPDGPVDASVIDGPVTDGPVDASVTDGPVTDGPTDGPVTDAPDMTDAGPIVDADVDAIPPDAGGGCGDGICDTEEDCFLCPTDCGACVCGDGVCSLGECGTCMVDCPGGCNCTHDECTPGPPLDPSCSQCANDICVQDPFCCTTDWDQVCVSHATTICNAMCPTQCGNGMCEPGEDAMNCPQDCVICGDGVCDVGETAMNCPIDCVICGDGICDASEDCFVCPGDCGTCVCGDGVCDSGECATCVADCPTGCNCPHDECSVGQPLEFGCSTCVNDVCIQDPFCCNTGWDASCVNQAVTICGIMCPTVCGNGICEPGEDPMTCPPDCGGICGDGVCDVNEDPMTCPPDCAGFCGDGICDSNENCSLCASDCGACVCGDGVCDSSECATCVADCPGGCNCPHDECTVGGPLDLGCSQCALDVCTMDPFCCTTSWDSVCIQQAVMLCNLMCPPFCGDGNCDPGEDSMTCPLDCPP